MYIHIHTYIYNIYIYIYTYICGYPHIYIQSLGRIPMQLGVYLCNT